MNLLPIVQELEGRTDQERKNIIVSHLTKLVLPYQIDSYQNGENIVVPSASTIGVTCHFDKVEGCPGANDNASGVAVTLDVLSKTHAKGIFFDDEEHGRNGSKQYVARHGVKDLRGVYNLDMVGIGMNVAIWAEVAPANTPLSSTITNLAARKRIPLLKIASGPSVSDHEYFRKAGIDAFSVTTMTTLDFLFVKKYEDPQTKCVHDWEQLMKESIIFSTNHRPDDTSEWVAEETLQMVSQLICEAIHELTTAIPISDAL